MKKAITHFYFILFCLIVSNSGLVNAQVWRVTSGEAEARAEYDVNTLHGDHDSLTFSWNKGSKSAVFRIYNENSGKLLVTILIMNFTGKGSYVLGESEAMYDNCPIAANKFGAIDITKIDTILKSIEGTFSFDGKCDDESIKKVKNGKFYFKWIPTVKVYPEDTLFFKNKDSVVYTLLAKPKDTIKVQVGSGDVEKKVTDTNGKVLFTYKSDGTEKTLKFNEVERLIKPAINLPVIKIFPTSTQGFQVAEPNDRKFSFQLLEKYRLIRNDSSSDSSVAEVQHLPVQAKTVPDGEKSDMAYPYNILKYKIEKKVEALDKSEADIINKWINDNKVTVSDPSEDIDISMKVAGGTYNKDILKFPAVLQKFYFDTLGLRKDGFLLLIDFGVAPANVYKSNKAHGYLLLSLLSSIKSNTTSESKIPSTSEDIFKLLDKLSLDAKTHNLKIINPLIDSLKKGKEYILSGAIPEYMTLYDFSPSNGILPETIDYMNQFTEGDASDLPTISYAGYGDVQGGNACGPSSLKMAMQALGFNVGTLKEVYDNVMQFGLYKKDGGAPVDNSVTQSLPWERAWYWLKGDSSYFKGKCIDSAGVQHEACRQFSKNLNSLNLDSNLVAYYNSSTATWAQVNARLDAGNPVMISTYFTSKKYNGTGGGHVILLLARGTNEKIKRVLKNSPKSDWGNQFNGDYYIVADPAGHYFGNAFENGMAGVGGNSKGHHGTTQGLKDLNIGISHGGFAAIYPKELMEEYGKKIETSLITISYMKYSSANASTFSTTVANTCSKSECPIGTPFAWEDKDNDKTLSGQKFYSLIITDPIGRRAGILEDGSLIDSIPGLEYTYPIYTREGNDSSDAGEVLIDSTDFIRLDIRSPMSGNYNIKLFTRVKGNYTVDFIMNQPDKQIFESKSYGVDMSADESRSFDINIPTGIEDEKIYGNMNVTIDSYVHENNLNINYYIHQSQNIRLRLFNALGQEISVLYDAYTNSGNHHLEYNTAHLPAGIYIISLSSDNSLNMNKFYIDK